KDSNSSHSPHNSRHSFEGNISPDQNVRQSKLNVSVDNVEHKNKIIERKNRRSSVHDERRRQSYWDAMHDKETMTYNKDAATNVFTGEEEFFAFDRTISRLYEMQSKVYWEKWAKSH
ncbi:hypothetical protein GQX74_011760, partial [Glossina fuscipes]